MTSRRGRRAGRAAQARESCTGERLYCGHVNVFNYYDAGMTDLSNISRKLETLTLPWPQSRWVSRCQSQTFPNFLKTCQYQPVYYAFEKLRRENEWILSTQNLLRRKRNFNNNIKGHNLWARLYRKIEKLKTPNTSSEDLGCVFP